jgi:hypothetical protein
MSLELIIHSLDVLTLELMLLMRPGVVCGCTHKLIKNVLLRGHANDLVSRKIYLNGIPSHTVCMFESLSLHSCNSL